MYPAMKEKQSDIGDCFRSFLFLQVLVLIHVETNCSLNDSSVNVHVICSVEETAEGGQEREICVFKM